MGNKGSKGGKGGDGGAAAVALPKGMVERYKGSFSEVELQALHAVFCSLGSRTDFVTIAEFLSVASPAAAAGKAGAAAVTGGGSLFLERVFRLFDVDADGRLSFDEFVAGVRCFAPAASEAKVRFSFRLYAQRDPERISPADLRELLADVLAHNGIALSGAQVDDVVRLTFGQHDSDRDGFISYAEYKHMCAENPSVLRNLTIHVNELMHSA